MMDPMYIGIGAGVVVVGAVIAILIWNAILSARKRTGTAIIAAAESSAAAVKAAAERDAGELRATAQTQASVDRERQLVAARGEAVGIKEEAVREASRRREEM